MALPTRLLDLSSLPSQHDIIHCEKDPHEIFCTKSFKLIETTASQGCYVALSYCWGKNIPYTTTSKNVEKHQGKGISYEEIPKTLQEAVLVTRLLGLQYLWIDSLCIIQDDQKDWEHEAARMGLVYSRAYITIAASRAHHCGEGFLQPRSTYEETRKMPFTDNNGSFELQFQYDDLQSSPSPIVPETDHPLRLHMASRPVNLIP